MSYLEGRKNIYSLISSNVIDYIKDNNSSNKELKNKSQLDNVFLGIPTNLVSSTTFYADCGDSNSSSCVDCMKKFGITDTMLDKTNYM